MNSHCAGWSSSAGKLVGGDVCCIVQATSCTVIHETIHSLPFLKEKASDENTYAPNVIEIMVLLGKLAKGSSDPLRREVARAVAAFYSQQPDQAHLEGGQSFRDGLSLANIRVCSTVCCSLMFVTGSDALCHCAHTQVCR